MLVGIWIIGWFITVIFSVFFNPLDSEEDRRKDLGGRLLAQGVMNRVMWPFVLVSLGQRRNLLRDMRTGKRPAWIMKAKGEESQRHWTLADGTAFRAFAWNESSSKPAEISADYEDEALTGPIECRSRMIAPENHPAKAWLPMSFDPHPEQHPPDDDASADEEDDTLDRYTLSLKLPRGKYALEFRATNRAGAFEEFSALTLIVADPEDYNL